MDYFVVQNSSDLTIEEKVRKIINSMSYFPLIFERSTTGAIKFTITPYKIPSPSAKKPKENQAIQWEAEIASGKAQPVSEFNSSIDPLLKKTLGEHFFKHNIAKVFIGGYPFILIGDRHTQTAFRTLLPLLIHEIHQRADEKIAFFLEACDRDSSVEAVFFYDHLKTINSNIKYNHKKMLYGIERCEVMQISGYIRDLYKIKMNSYNVNDRQQLFYTLCQISSVQKLWEDLKQTQLTADMKTMITIIDQAIHTVQTQQPHLGWKMIEKSQFYMNSNSWNNLLTAFINLIIEKPIFQDDIKIQVKNFLANPQEGDLFQKLLGTINQQIRDPAIIENMWSIIHKLPQTTEIVLFLGYLHMQPVIQGLQKQFAQS